MLSSTRPSTISPRRPAAVLAALGLVAAGLAAATAPAAPSAAVTSPVTSPVTGAATPPSGATLVVSQRGHDAAAGTAAAPLRTIGAAIDRARAGSTIVVRHGSYHESLTVPAGETLTIRSARGATVWLDGSRRVRSWRPTGEGWVHDGWNVTFDASPTYHWGAPDGDEPGWSFVNDEHPLAAHPDQVWIDGRPQRQVGSTAQLTPGTFYVDEYDERLHLGSDPTGHVVRASTLPTALAVRAAGTTVSGIGVRRFAPSVPHMGAVTVEAPDVTLSRMIVRDNATTGLHVSAAGAQLRRVRTLHNGMLGLGATYADGLRLWRVASRDNNAEGFNYAPVAGGIKIGRTRGVQVVQARIQRNAGTGLWFDESSHAITVLDSTIRDNGRHGISLEISDGGLVADTVIAGNAGDGIKVNDTSDVELWNNTIVDNGRPVNIVQDDRDASDPRTPGHDPRQPVPAPGMTWINGPVQVHNNIVATRSSGANCLLCVEDYSERFSAEELGVESSGNVYAQSAKATPGWVAIWSRGASDPRVFTTVAAFQRATGQERTHLALVGTAAVTADLRATEAVRTAESRVAEGLPAWLASALSRAEGVRHLGAWLD